MDIRNMIKISLWSKGHTEKKKNRSCIRTVFQFFDGTESLLDCAPSRVCSSVWRLSTYWPLIKT